MSTEPNAPIFVFIHGGPTESFINPENLEKILESSLIHHRGWPGFEGRIGEICVPYYLPLFEEFKGTRIFALNYTGNAFRGVQAVSTDGCYKSFEIQLKDIKEQIEIISKKYPNAQLSFMGHSFGSFLLYHTLPILPEHTNVILSGIPYEETSHLPCRRYLLETYTGLKDPNFIENNTEVIRKEGQYIIQDKKPLEELEEKAFNAMLNVITTKSLKIMILQGVIDTSTRFLEPKVL